MRLVFITRKVDRGDPLTGFVFGWLNQLASRLADKRGPRHSTGQAGSQTRTNADKSVDLYVICQEKGDTAGLASNIELYSFGKEKGYGKLRQGYQLFIISYKLAPKASGFFIHMHPIYAILAWLPAKLSGKKIVLWYTHKSVDLKLKIAHALVDVVFTASKESFRLPSKKVRVVGHGIDLTKFEIRNSKFETNPKSKNPKFKILSIGRISPVKDYETLIKAVEILVNHKNIKDLKVEIYGKLGLPEHQSYLKSLLNFVENAGLDEYIDYQGELNYEYVDEVLSEADLFVNMSGTGSIDKSVLEAAASGVLVLTSNEAFAKPLSKISPLLVFQKDNPAQLAEKILQIKALPAGKKNELGRGLRSWVEREHNLDNLVNSIIHEFYS